MNRGHDHAWAIFAGNGTANREKQTAKQKKAIDTWKPPNDKTVLGKAAEGSPCYYDQRSSDFLTISPAFSE